MTFCDCISVCDVHSSQVILYFQFKISNVMGVMNFHVIFLSFLSIKF